MTIESHAWFSDDDDHEHACAVFYFADARCTCKDPEHHADGPPFDAATATGMYDHDDTQ